jgi:hypothetical protein
MQISIPCNSVELPHLARGVHASKGHGMIGNQEKPSPH